MRKGALKPIIKITDFEFSKMTGVQKVVLFVDGCLVNLPVFESQIGIYFDTYGCVSESFANAIEILLDRMIELKLIPESKINWLKSNGYIINGRVRLSNRWLIVRSGTNPELGNSGSVVAYFARKNGLAPLTLCDWNLSERDVKNNKEAYYDGSTIDKKADEIALEFSKLFDIQYEWVDMDNLDEASREGVVQVYTRAWYKRNGKYYNPYPGTCGHAIDFGQYSTISIIDQYEPQIKEMEKIDDFYPIALKINITQKYMDKPILKNNTLIQLVSGDGGFGMYLDGFIFVDDTAKILASWLMRNNGKIEGMIKPLVQEQWDMFEKKDLKGNLL